MNLAKKKKNTGVKIESNLVESSAPLSGHFANVHDGFRIVGIDVENGGIHDTSYIRAIR